jgi:hypothetical protein
MPRKLDKTRLKFNCLKKLKDLQCFYAISVDIVVTPVCIYDCIE